VFLGNTIFVSVTALAIVACSGSGRSAQDPNAPIRIETSQFSVVIENKVGMPLIDVDVAILPVGGATMFQKYAGRVENAAKREIALADFYGRDGTPFNLRVVRPKTVRVTAKDSTNKAYKVEVPWE
jgi:hypothetical protein